MQSQIKSINSYARRPSFKKTPSGHLIESGVPVPDLPKVWEYPRSRKRLVDLSGMSIGDSVFVAAANKPAMLRARHNTYEAAKRAKIKTTVRAVEGGLRVWRVA